MPGAKGRKEVGQERTALAELLGLHLCEGCLKTNEECMKSLIEAKKVDEPKEYQLMDIAGDLRAVKEILTNNNKLAEA